MPPVRLEPSDSQNIIYRQKISPAGRFAIASVTLYLMRQLLACSRQKGSASYLGLGANAVSVLTAGGHAYEFDIIALAQRSGIPFFPMQGHAVVFDE